MSAAVALSSKMPGDPETNGLDSFATRLVDQPDELMVAIVWLDTQKVTIDTDSGDHIPTARLRRIEPLGEVGDIPMVIVDLVQKAIQKRTGRTPIPFESGEVDEGHDPDQATLDEA